MSRVVLKQVTKRYGDTFAVRGLDLDIQEGEFLTLLGPSGQKAIHRNHGRFPKITIL